jgi:hypothetical protein
VAEGVRGEDVEAIIANERCRPGDRIEDVLHARPDDLRARTSPPWRHRGLDRSGEVEQMRALGIVELEGASECLEHARRHATHLSALKTRVIRDADAREDRDLLAAQAGHAAPA